MKQCPSCGGFKDRGHVCPTVKPDYINMGKVSLVERIEELEAECNDLAHQLNQCNERGGHIIAENKRLRDTLKVIAFKCEPNWEPIHIAEEALRNPSAPTQKEVASGKAGE